MATITTGDTDILRTYYELRMGTYDVFESVYQFLERHWYETSVSPQTLLMGPETGTSIFYSDGSTFSVEGTLSEHPTEWRIIKIEAQLSGSDDRIVFEGNMSFDSEFKIAPGSSINTVTVFDPAGGMQLLNRNAMPSSAQLIGNLQIETNGNPFASIMYTEKSASWDDGLKLRLLGQTFDSNESGASEMTQTIDTVIVEQNGEEIFRIDDFGFVNSALTDEILDAGPDAFIEHFLSGDDDITGTNGNDAIYSGDGNDMVQSGAGDDAVDSGDGDDEIIGGSGLGDDYYDGGSGTDVVKYTSATSGIEVNLAEGFARSLQGDAQIGTDTLIRIESVIGGSFSDRLVGDAQATNNQL